MTFAAALCWVALAATPTADAGKADAGAAKAVTAELKDAQGKAVGQATLTQTPAGLLIRAKLEGLPPGPHAFHIHEHAKCEAPTFKSAGGHYNPGGHQHGFENPKGAHQGDLPNLFVPPSGQVQVEVVNPTGAQLEKLLQTGAALVLHASADDYRTDPAGGAGDRIACGVIAKKVR